MRRRVFLKTAAARCLAGGLLGAGLLTGGPAGCARLETVKHTLPIKHVTDLGELAVYSDFPVPSDHRLLVEVSRQRADLVRKLDLPESREPVRVYLFDSADRYREFMLLYYPELPARRAFFMQTDTRLVVYAHWGDRVAEDLRHEVTHGYLHAVIPRIPLWIDEGLAENFEVPAPEMGVNRPHVDLLMKVLDNGWQPDLIRLEKLDSLSAMTQLDYAESWLWVHWMLETAPERRDILNGYLRALRHDPQPEPLSTRIRRSLGASGDDLIAYVRELSAR
jgi:hypothetical protein